MLYFVVRALNRIFFFQAFAVHMVNSKQLEIGAGWFP